MAGIVSPPSLITHVTNNACYHSPGSLPVKTQQTLRLCRRVCCCYCEERKTTQLPALVGDDHAGGRPLKDGDMQLLLQSVYQIADAGLGDVQLLGALLNDPHRSTMDTYFSCCNVIRTPSLPAALLLLYRLAAFAASLFTFRRFRPPSPGRTPRTAGWRRTAPARPSRRCRCCGKMSWADGRPPPGRGCAAPSAPAAG